ncbi:MAG: putative redox protein [Rhodothermales bacterium]|jgi:putative redox protein
MVEIDISYEGDLRTRAQHGPSQNTVITDAPVDNCGKGESFSPTDLVATALGSCVATLMGIVAQRDKLDLAGLRVHVAKEMAPNPRRIVALPVTVTAPASLTPEQREKLETGAKHCPVHYSIHPDIDAPITFKYE